MHKALFNLPVLLTAVFSLAATLVITAIVFADKPDEPTLLLDESVAVPAFTVTDHRGEALSRDDLIGRVWVCDFFLTRCTGVCPILGQQMADLAGELAQDDAFADVRLVSFSVDPDHDTVDRLAAYRKKYLGVWDGGSDQRRSQIEARWVHTRPDDRDAFWQIVGKGGFNLYVGEVANDPTTPIAHSSKLVLIDKQGRIRGYYEGVGEEEVPALLADIRRLVAEPGDG